MGIYGVLNYGMGARRSAILRWAGLHAARLVVVGIMLGALGDWGALRYLQSLVFGVSARNPAMILVSGVAVIAIAALAASVSVWRATRVDSVRNLHDA